MILFMRHRRKALWIVALLVASLITAGCAAIQPYAPRNNREEGPEKGLFTGSQGEWVILGPKVPRTDEEEKKNGAQESETNRAAEKDPDKPTDGEQ